MERNRPDSGRNPLLTKSDTQFIAASVAAFIAAGLLTALIALDMDAQPWFAAILGVANGMLSFMAVRTAFGDDSMDNPNTNAYVILGGVLAFVGITLAYITIRIWPLGEHCALIIDMYHQYVAFFSLLREKLLTGGSLLYNTSAGLGQGFLPLFAYYLSSPYNLLLLVFPREYITEAIVAITMLKISSAGVTFAIMARRLFRRNDFSIVCGSVAYALMSFFVGHSWNLMWLDPLVLLPLIVLGLELLLRRNKPGLYCITLALAIITNYYIAYMICLFLILYFIAQVICESKNFTLEMQLKRFWRFCYGSLIAGGISLFLLLPTAIYLAQTSGAEDSFARDVTSNFDLFQIFQRMLFSASPSMRGDSLPNIYCSVLAVFTLVLFLACKGISLRKRLAYGGIVGFLIISSSVNLLNFLWHGTHFPNDLPYRFSFLISFAMVYIMAMMLSKIKTLDLKQVLISFVIVAGCILCEERFGEATSDYTMIYTSLAFVAVYATIIALCAAGKLRQTVAYALLLIFVFSEVSANAAVELQELDFNEYYTERSTFISDYELRDALIEKIDSYDEPEYRSEFLPRKTCNDPSLFGYDGLTVFASSNTKAVTTFMGKLGYAVNGVNSYLYNNYVPVTDSILGLKYLTLDNDIGMHEQLALTDTVSHYDETNSISDTVYIYENTTALSRMFLVNPSIVTWNMHPEMTYVNPFEIQNNFTIAATGQAVYTLNQPLAQPETINCSATITGNNFSMSADTSNYSFAQMTAKYAVETAGQVYVYVDCRAADSISISSNGLSWNSSPNEPHIIDLGYLAQGTDVSVMVNCSTGCSGNVYIATLNNDAYLNVINTLRTGEPVYTEFTDSNIVAEVSTESERVMFTSIPYDTGWTVRIDGEKVDIYPLGDALMCFAVPAGTHTVELTYTPRGFVVGIVISLLSIGCLILLMRRDWAEKILSVFTRGKRPLRYARAIDPAYEGFEEVDLSELEFEDE